VSSSLFPSDVSTSSFIVIPDTDMTELGRGKLRIRSHHENLRDPDVLLFEEGESGQAGQLGGGWRRRRSSVVGRSSSTSLRGTKGVERSVSGFQRGLGGKREDARKKGSDGMDGSKASELNDSTKEGSSFPIARTYLPLLLTSYSLLVHLIGLLLLRSLVVRHCSRRRGWIPKDGRRKQKENEFGSPPSGSFGPE